MRNIRTRMVTSVMVACILIVVASGPLHRAHSAQLGWQGENVNQAGGDYPDIDTQLTALDDLPIDEFLDRSFEMILLRSPEWISWVGLEDHFDLRADQLDDLSDDYVDGSYYLKASILSRLLAYDRAALSAEQQVSFDVYRWWLETEARREQFMYHDWTVHHFLNSYNDNLLTLFTQIHPLETQEDAEDYIARLSQIDDQVAQMIERLQISVNMGIVPPGFIIDMTINRLQNDLAMQGFSNPDRIQSHRIGLYTYFNARLEQIEGLEYDEREALRDAAVAEIEASFIPAFVSLMEYLQSIRDLAGADAGLWRLPDGDNFYEFMLLDSTSTAMTAQEIHDLGLREVERIQTEFYAVFEELGYDTSQEPQYLMGLAMDDGGYLSDRDEIMAYYDDLLIGVDAEINAWFDVRPQAELIVVGETRGGGGYYTPASIDGSRPGAFHAGAQGPIPTYFLPTITYHEGNPGHHFQIALALEMDLPLLRNVIVFNAYVEGWALYAERLALEMGLYDDNPYGNIGRLELELLRAVRLVTDTGIHALGWTRYDARAYMYEAMGGDGWIHEVERYIVLPGQATGYMVGMLTILDLRDRAQQQLGDAFDIVEFHNIVLTNGSLPLTILEQVVEAWITENLTAS